MEKSMERWNKDDRNMFVRKLVRVELGEGNEGEVGGEDKNSDKRNGEGVGKGQKKLVG